jgi:DNA-binding transcriptional regulator YbjK
VTAPATRPAARGGRGEVRRRLILEAAVRVIGTGGLAAVTHRAVAEEAGVPLGSTTYYFRDREDLLGQTMAHAADAEPSVERSVTLLTAIFLDKSVADPLYDLALFEMFLEATRNPAVRAQTRQWSELIAQIVDRLLPATTPEVPRAVVVQVVAALIDGLMLEAASNRELSVPELAAHLRAVIERFAV